MTKLKKLKIPKDKWVQIGGDVDYESDLILGKFNSTTNDLHVIQIQQDNGKFFGQESEFDINELKERDIEEFGFDVKNMKDNGLELIAESILTNDGGDPINCDGQADYRSKFKSLKNALRCAIGEESSFTAWDGKKEIKVQDLSEED